MYIQNQQSIKTAARATSRTSYNADPDKKRAASHASYIAELDKRPSSPPPMRMQAKVFLMLTGVQIETYTTHILKHIPFQYHLPHTFTPTHLLPSPKKLPKTSYRKSTLPKSAKTSHVGMDFHQKTLPQKPMKQATMHVHRNACTDYPHITAQCIYCIATIPTSFQPHPSLFAPHPHTQLHTQYFLQHTPPSTIITIKYPPLHPYPQPLHSYFTKHSTPHYNPKPSQECYLLPSICISLHKSHIHKHKPNRAIPHINHHTQQS